jgi:fumarate hydratase, class II
MNAISTLKEQYIRKETDSLGVVEVPGDKLWGAQTQRSLEHFSIGHDLIPREMIAAYATLKKAAAYANHAGKRLDDQRHKLIVTACDEILAGRHEDMFPLHVWMTGSGTQFNMNVNELISDRCWYSKRSRGRYLASPFCDVARIRSTLGHARVSRNEDGVPPPTFDG